MTRSASSFVEVRKVELVLQLEDDDDGLLRADDAFLDKDAVAVVGASWRYRRGGRGRTAALDILVASCRFVLSSDDFAGSLPTRRRDDDEGSTRLSVDVFELPSLRLSGDVDGPLLCGAISF